MGCCFSKKKSKPNIQIPKPYPIVYQTSTVPIQTPVRNYPPPYHEYIKTVPCSPQSYTYPVQYPIQPNTYSIQYPIQPNICSAQYFSPPPYNPEIMK